MGVAAYLRAFEWLYAVVAQRLKAQYMSHGVALLMHVAYARCVRVRACALCVCVVQLFVSNIPFLLTLNSDPKVKWI